MVRKLYLYTAFIVSAALLAACAKKNGNDNSTVISPTSAPTVTAQPINSGNEGTETTTDKEEAILNVQDFYPFQANTEYIYEGTGNEYASYQSFTDFISNDAKRIQTRTNNGGTETVRVIELKDGKLSVVYKADECYYRDNFIDKPTESSKTEVLLMEPLVKGTQWTLPDGRKRMISGTDVAITTPSGTYKAIEVTTENEDGRTMDYYASGIGLVKTVFRSGDTQVTSSLSEINKDTPYTQAIDVYYPDSDEKLNREQLTLTFHTGDITRQVLEKAVKEQIPDKEYLPLLTSNVKINSLYLGSDGIVYADFSSDLVKEMNVGSGFEEQILQGITNTLGYYYGAKEVYITVDGKPYESGVILMKKGETFKVK